jgi:hypothetical protein
MTLAYDSAPGVEPLAVVAAVDVADVEARAEQPALSPSASKRKKILSPMESNSSLK